MNDPCPSDRETREALARLDERIKALAREIERTEAAGRREVEIAAAELARRLDILNHAHQEAVMVQRTYVPRETYERDHKEDDSRMRKLESLADRMWWPMLFIAACAAALAGVVVKLVFP